MSFLIKVKSNRKTIFVCHKIKTEMFNYQDVFTKFKEAVPIKTVPNYIVDPEKGCSNKELEEKKEKRYKEYNAINSSNLKYKKKGVCGIGQLTGNELLRVFLNICNNNYKQPGNCIF